MNSFINSLVHTMNFFSLLSSYLIEKPPQNFSLTISMTIFRRDCLCFFVKFWKMSQFSSCRSLKPTARWWFSNTDESLYIKASSESAGRTQVITDVCGIVGFLIITKYTRFKYISWQILTNQTWNGFKKKKLMTLVIWNRWLFCKAKNKTKLCSI